MRKLVAVPSPTRDATTGKFAEGNAGSAQMRLLDVDHANVAPWMAPYLRQAERRFRGMKTSGLMKGVATRCDGILRAACVADAVHDALAAHAVTLADVHEARVVLADARTWATSGQKAWSKLFALVGVKRGAAAGGDGDPLAKLARELGGDDE